MKNKRGRPKKNGTTIWIVTLRLHPGQDDDLIAFRDSLPDRHRSAAVKTALRAGGITLKTAKPQNDDELYDAADSFLI